MTPLEGGVFGVGVLVLGAVFLTRTVQSTLWTAVGAAAAAGAALATGPGNRVLLWWTPRGGHTGGVAGDPGGYYLGVFGGSPAGDDLRVLTFVLLGVAVVCFFHTVTPPPGYESLLVGVLAVGAGLVTLAVDNLVTLYVGLELQALSLYTLVGFYKFDDERTDSSVRYLLSGSLVSGFMLLGFARGYSLNGGFHLVEFTGVDPVGTAWVAGVLLFKVGVFPFHFWSPVVYTPLEWVTLALVLGATKVNPWYLLVFNLTPGFTGWPAFVAGAASVGVGAVGGYFQTGVAPLLAYSGVVNGGYLLLLVGAAPPDGGFAFGYYLVVYLGGTLLLVAVLSVFGSTKLTDLTNWNKLGVLFPLVVYYLALNVGGLPVFPGFFAKVVLLRGLLGLGFAVAAAVVAVSVVPAVYYVTVAAAGLFGYSDREGTPPAGVSAGLVVVLVLLLSGGVTAVAGGVT